METPNMMTDDFLDASACDALGAHSPAEAAAYQQQLAAGGRAAQTADRQMREAVATLSAASPHMEPPSELRGRILAATAPQTFRMEDYRKANRDDSKFYRWGFYAAAMFLVFASLYNMNSTNKLNQSIARSKGLEQRMSELAKLADAQTGALTNALANPNNVQLIWRDELQRPIGRAIVDVANHKAVMIFPQELVPQGTQPQLTLDINNQKITFETSVITAPAQTLGMTLPENAPKVAEFMNALKLSPDEAKKLNDEALKVRNASMH